MTGADYPGPSQDRPAAPTYEYLSSAPIPDDVPELGISAGDTGCVVDVLDAGDPGTLHVVLDRSGPELAVSALVDLEVLPDGTARVVGHARL